MASTMTNSTDDTPAIKTVEETTSPQTATTSQTQSLFNSLNLQDNKNSIDDALEPAIPGIQFVNYRDESQLECLMELVGRDLSEPYSIFTYRYFLHQWPDLCIFAVTTPTPDQKGGVPVGCVVCKIDEETEEPLRQNDFPQPLPKIVKSGYLAMLAVEKSFRKSGIGTALVRRVVRRMRRKGCASISLETEVKNEGAMRLYEDRLGFVREEKLVRYYLNWGDAYRLRLWFDDGEEEKEEA